MSLTAVARADTRRLPLRDRSVDLVVTSPPYFALRDYGYPGQIGAETTPADWLEALWAVTAEWMRVLKPEGSLFVNLGDKYSSASAGSNWHTAPLKGRGRLPELHVAQLAAPKVRPGGREKSLLGLPWRYAIGCMDRLGLILRAEIIWSKPNGLPESVTDRARRSHEQVFHFVKQPRYYSAVDDIREPQKIVFRAPQDGTAHHARAVAAAEGHHRYGTRDTNPLGKLPGSVWEPVTRQALRALLKDVARGTTSPEDAERQLSDGMPGVWHIPSAPLAIPERIGVDHFAAFPPALVRPIVAGWSPPAICTACGEGRRPAAEKTYRHVQDRRHNRFADGLAASGMHGRGRPGSSAVPDMALEVTVTGYVCACTPYTDHEAEPGRPRDGQGYARETGRDAHPHGGVGVLPRTGPWRQYHLGGWQPPPSVPGVVLDPFGGTGTTALVASVLGRRGVTLDLSAGYGRAAQWRVHDPGERARALGVAKPPPVPDGQGELFGLM